MLEQHYPGKFSGKSTKLRNKTENVYEIMCKHPRCAHHILFELCKQYGSEDTKNMLVSSRNQIIHLENL